MTFDILSVSKGLCSTSNPFPFLLISIMICFDTDRGDCVIRQRPVRSLSLHGDDIYGYAPWIRHYSDGHVDVDGRTRIQSVSRADGSSQAGSAAWRCRFVSHHDTRVARRSDGDPFVARQCGNESRMVSRVLMLSSIIICFEYILKL